MIAGGGPPVATSGRTAGATAAAALAATSLAIFDTQGMLVPYAPAGLNRMATQ